METGIGKWVRVKERPNFIRFKVAPAEEDHSLNQAAPPKVVHDYFGQMLHKKLSLPNKMDPERNRSGSLMNLNDKYEYSLGEIADAIEEQW